jgi:class 3 adenylate cyclase
VASRTLTEALEVLQQAGFAAWVADARGHVVGVTDDMLMIYGSGVERPRVPLGAHIFSEEWVSFQATSMGGVTLEGQRKLFAELAPGLLVDRDVDELRAMIDPRLHDLLDGLEPSPAGVFWSGRAEVNFGERTTSVDFVAVPLYDEHGERVGSASIGKPGVSGVVMSMLAMGDAALFERILRLVRPARRATAILFADLESSTALSRRLSTHDYFALVRRLTWRADKSVVEAGGIVGKHVGDGITAFFIAEHAGSESAAARACLEAAQAIRRDTAAAARRSALDPDQVVIRIGLHWGATVYIGGLLTTGRMEVTALGDEVNEAARIEACATGGLTLASKQLIERLEGVDADTLGLDTRHMQYQPLGELPGAPEKARRDAPAVAVTAL